MQLNPIEMNIPQPKKLSPPRQESLLPPPLQPSLSSTTPTTNRFKLSLLNNLDDPKSDLFIKSQQQRSKEQQQLQQQQQQHHQPGLGLGSGITASDLNKAVRSNTCNNSNINKTTTTTTTATSALKKSASSTNIVPRKKSHHVSSTPAMKPSTSAATATTTTMRRAASYRQPSSSSSSTTTSPQQQQQQQPWIDDSTTSSSYGRSAKSVYTALKYYGQYLSDYERQIEIHDYTSIYFVGPHAKTKNGKLNVDCNNYGFDDDRGDYKIVLQDHLAYRYEVIDILGRGSFGQVVKCFDHKTGTVVAIKLIRNKKRFHAQALTEVNILKKLIEWDPHGQYNTIQMTDHFYFRNHLCIAFECLSMNLYEFIKSNHFQGFSLSLIKR